MLRSMGLRSFHILFIVMATLLSAGFGLWCFLSDAGRELSGSTAMGAISLLAAVGLVVYGIKFVKKLDEEGID